jgi:glycosyltransferase involved in cell wall biosynthesis
MSVPAVSVVMPAYNHERFVGETIASVLGQSFEDFELVIVDDGSTDGTAEVIHSFSDPRIRYHHQHNEDAFNALNKGMALSRGRYLSILNSDDLYTPTRLQVLHDACESGARFVFTDVEPIDDRGESLADTPHPWNAWHQGNREFYFAKRELYRGFLHGNYMVTTSNIFITRELFDTVGGFAPIRYLHDYDYLFRLLLVAEPQTRYLDDQRLLKYRIHAGNTLGEAAIIGREQDREIIRKYLLARLPEAVRGHADAGIDRLIALEHELIHVRRQLARQQASEPAPTPTVTRRILSRLKRSLPHGG